MRGAAAVIAGYVVTALLSTLVQELWLGGVSYQNSARSVLILAAIFTPLCGVAGGIATSLIFRTAWFACGLALCAVIAIETTYLYVTHRVDGPLWFEAGAAIALGAAVMLGSWVGRNWLSKSSGR